MAAEEKDAEGGMFFLSDGRVYSNEDIVHEIASVLDAKIMKMRIPMPLLSLLVKVSEKMGRGASIINKDKLKELGYFHWTCDSSKAGKDFKFVPKVSIKEGIKWTADWYRIHQWL